MFQFWMLVFCKSEIADDVRKTFWCFDSQDHSINQDVSADINLINKLTAAAVQRPVPQVALTSNCASETRAISNETWKNHESPTAANQFDHPTLPAEDHDDADGGSLVIAFKEESSPSRKVSFYVQFLRICIEIHNVGIYTADVYTALACSRSDIYFVRMKIL